MHHVMIFEASSWWLLCFDSTRAQPDTLTSGVRLVCSQPIMLPMLIEMPVSGRHAVLSDGNALQCSL